MKPKHNPWYLFNETVILYHGTSSAFIPIIKERGILPPDENLEEYAHRIVRNYLNEVPEEVADKIRRHTLSMRSDNERNKVGSVIYLSGDWRQAKDYANSYYRYGGEIGYEIWRWVNEYEAHKLGKQFNFNSRSTDIIYRNPLYKDAYPIVVEVEVPREWMMTYRNLKDTWENAVRMWKKMRKWHRERDISFKDYIKGIEGVEIRVKDPIPVQMIRKIHDLPKISLLRPGEPES